MGNRKKDLETVAVLAVFLLVVYFLTKKAVFILAALVLLAVAILFKDIASRIASAWMGFSRVISFINTRIILTILFYLILTPLALIRRLFGKDHLKLKKNPPATTYFDTRDHTFTKEDFEKVW